MRVIPQGAIRLNTDSQKLEFYAQDQWWEMATDVPTLDGGTRAVFGGSYTYGVSPANYAKTNVIDYITIATAGDATDFGDLTETRGPGGAGASRTRGLFCGGNINPSPLKTSNTVDYVTIASTGTCTNYGDLTVKGGHGIATMTNQTRLVCAGRNTQDPSSYPGADVNTIDYTTIASTGNFKDFGDLVDPAGASAPIYGVTGCSNGIRGIISGGDEGPAYDLSLIHI